MGLFGKKKDQTAVGGEHASAVATGTPSEVAPADAGPAAPERPPKTRRRKVSAAELESLRADVVDLRARLDEAEKAKWLMEHRLRALDATATTLAADKERLTELAGKVHGIELQVATAREAVVGAGDEAAGATIDLPELGTKFAALEAKLVELQTKLDTPPSPLLTPRPLLPTSGAEPSALERERLERLETLTQRLAAVDALGEQVAQLAERLASTDSAARSTSDHVAAIDQRLSNIGTELANQISELGRDIDALAERPPAETSDAAEPSEPAVSAEVVDALRAGQVKLANEQARYEIAFRQDLAALAEQVRQASRR